MHCPPMVRFGPKAQFRLPSTYHKVNPERSNPAMSTAGKVAGTSPWFGHAVCCPVSARTGGADTFGQDAVAIYMHPH